MLTYAQARALNSPAASCLLCLGPMAWQPYLICEPCTRQLTEEGRFIEARDELYPLIKRAGMNTQKEQSHVTTD